MPPDPTPTAVPCPLQVGRHQQAPESLRKEAMKLPPKQKKQKNVSFDELQGKVRTLRCRDKGLV